MHLTDFKMKKLILFLAIIFIGIFAVANSIADEWTENSTNINEMTVFVDGIAAFHGYCIADENGVEDDENFICRTYQLSNPGIERNDRMAIKTIFKSGTYLSNIKIHAWINTPDKIEAYTEKFDAFENSTYARTLFLDIPYDIDAFDYYTLYVKIESKKKLGGIDEADIDLNVQRIANSIEILSADIYDAEGKSTSAFQPGDILYADVVIKNRGSHYAEDVYLKLNIGEIERTVYIGDLAPRDNSKEDTELVRVRMPLPDDYGRYTLKIEAYTNDNEIADKVTKIITTEKENTNVKDNKEDAEVNDDGDLYNILIILGIVFSIAIIILLVIALTKDTRKEKVEDKKGLDKFSLDSYY